MSSGSPARAIDGRPGRWRFGLKLLQAAISAALLTWIFHTPETRAGIAALLAAADPRWLGLAVVIAGATVAVSITRWHCVLHVLGIPIPFRRAAAIWLIGYFFDLFILGATGGDLMKALLVIREAPQRKITAALSILIDHFTGIFALALAAALFTLSRADTLLAHPATAAIFWLLIAYLALCLSAVPLIIVVGLVPPPAWVRRRDFFRRHGGEVHQAFRAMLTGWRGMLKAAGLSFAAWSGQFTIFYCSARAIGAAVSARDLLAATPISEALVTVPISIAGLGVREQSFQFLLGALGGVPLATAVLVSLGGFTASLVWNLCGGVVFAFYRQRRLH
ncbi:MAG: lysylphosphatidylglycerol synthase transmembrane domain-containing protein [Terrimicrobiaceae bacterium]|nr:lysylphosphatidylglycerol synthase transmembrane domain-containing protein [Terrimicrobiaceae bacterium]